MEYEKMSMQDLAVLLQTQLDNGGRARLLVSGFSMHPTLRYYRDTVFLVPVTRPLRKGDLPLYRRKNGDYILHRIVTPPKNGVFFCCGDNQWQKERVEEDQVVALVDGFLRGDKLCPENKPAYRLWVGFWLLMMPVRRPVLACRRLFGKWKKRLQRSL